MNKSRTSRKAEGHGIIEQIPDHRDDAAQAAKNGNEQIEIQSIMAFEFKIDVFFLQIFDASHNIGPGASRGNFAVKHLPHGGLNQLRGALFLG